MEAEEGEVVLTTAQLGEGGDTFGSRSPARNVHVESTSTHTTETGSSQAVMDGERRRRSRSRSTSPRNAKRRRSRSRSRSQSRRDDRHGYSGSDRHRHTHQKERRRSPSRDRRGDGRGSRDDRRHRHSSSRDRSRDRKSDRRSDSRDRRDSDRFRPLTDSLSDSRDRKRPGYGDRDKREGPASAQRPGLPDAARRAEHTDDEDDGEFARKIEEQMRAKQREDERIQELRRIREAALASRVPGIADAAVPSSPGNVASPRAGPVAALIARNASAAAALSDSDDEGSVAAGELAPDETMEELQLVDPVARAAIPDVLPVPANDADEELQDDDRADRRHIVRPAPLAPAAAAPVPAATAAAPPAPAPAAVAPARPAWARRSAKGAAASLDDDDDMFAPPKPVSTATATTTTEAGAAGSPVTALVTAAPKQAPAPRAALKENLNLRDNWDDEEGYYMTRVGEVLDGRYRITTSLGSGVFSSVVRAVDEQDPSGREVAIKIIRSNETMYKAGQKELAILTKLNEADPNDRKHVIRLLASFEHRGHLCLVFESMKMNLRELVRAFGRHVGLHMRAVRVFAQHLFLALSLLSTSGVLHADIKPDNVLLNEAKTSIKLSDLGSASFSDERDITPYLVSRFYRAPEIILGLQYDSAIDVWSVACTLFELYTGKILFPGKTNNQMLRLIQEVKGAIPNRVIRRGQFASRFFDDTFRFISVEEDKLTKKSIVRHIAFTPQPTRDLKSMLLGNLAGMKEEVVTELRRFVDLLDQCLNLNPAKRLTPEQALRHPFIRGK